MEIPTPQALMENAKYEEIYKSLQTRVADQLHKFFTGDNAVSFGIDPSLMPNIAIKNRLIKEVESKGWSIHIGQPNTAGIRTVVIRAN